MAVVVPCSAHFRRHKLQRRTEWRLHVASSKRLGCSHGKREPCHLPAKAQKTRLDWSGVSARTAKGAVCFITSQFTVTCSLFHYITAYSNQQFLSLHHSLQKPAVSFIASQLIVTSSLFHYITAYRNQQLICHYTTAYINQQFVSLHHSLQQPSVHFIASQLTVTCSFFHYITAYSNQQFLSLRHRLQ